MMRAAGASQGVSGNFPTMIFPPWGQPTRCADRIGLS
jgi:hypothetical protein